MRKMSSRSSTLTPFLPARIGWRESQVQYSLKPARCHRTTVSGWTRINVSRHRDQKPPQYHPEKSVRNSKARMRTPPFQDSKLLPESQILQEEIAAGTKEHDHRNRQQLHQA